MEPKISYKVIVYPLGESAKNAIIVAQRRDYAKCKAVFDTAYHIVPFRVMLKLVKISEIVEPSITEEILQEG